MSTQVKVSILCVTYNHEKYIAETLDSFLMQKTDFPFEIIIHDDKSTDKTEDIIRKYAKQYPGVIRPIFEKENQYQQGKDNFVKDMLVMARGAYIAECEGDDFWTDADKLQKQADFMDAHPGYNICFHPVRVFFENSEEPDSIYPGADIERKWTTARLLRRNFIQSNSVMYRRRASYDDFALHIMPFDWYTHLYHAQDGKIGFINKVMSAYRRHASGVWWTSYSDNDAVWKQYGLQHLRAYTELFRLYKDKPAEAEYIRACLRSALLRLQEVGAADNQAWLNKALERYPETASTLMLATADTLRDQDAQLQKYQADILTVQAQYKNMEAHLTALVSEKDKEIARLAGELHMIQSSRLWRARNKVARAVKGRHSE